MNELQIYNSIREEIVTNHVLMHWFTLLTILILLFGVYIVENHKTILSIFLPLLSVAWAAAIVRFDFFVHRQNAYLKALGYSMQLNGSNTPLWETWKDGLIATPFVIPMADVFLFLVVALPTFYVLTGPTQLYFKSKSWKGGKVYAVIITTIFILLLGSLSVIPKLAQWRSN